MKEHTWTVVSLGGSIIVPDRVDTTFLEGFAQVVRTHLRTGMRFIIIAGGGKTARMYQDAARTLCATNGADLDWLGIHATRLNGHLLRTIFRKEAHPNLIKDAKTRLPKDKKIIIAAGWQPGNSTDLVAVELAKKVGATRMINLSNISHVYSADPRTNPSAERFEALSWKGFRKLLPKKWDPGLSSPFDPVAAQRAESLGIEVAVIRGTSLVDVDAYLRGERFDGTRIS